MNNEYIDKWNECVVKFINDFDINISINDIDLLKNPYSDKIFSRKELKLYFTPEIEQRPIIYKDTPKKIIERFNKKTLRDLSDFDFEFTYDHDQYLENKYGLKYQFELLRTKKDLYDIANIEYDEHEHKLFDNFNYGGFDNEILPLLQIEDDNGIDLNFFALVFDINIKDLNNLDFSNVGCSFVTT